MKCASSPWTGVLCPGPRPSVAHFVAAGRVTRWSSRPPISTSWHTREFFRERPGPCSWSNASRSRPEYAQVPIYVTDPNTWTRSWSAEAPLPRVGPPLMSSCHEQNYCLMNVVTGSQISEGSRKATSSRFVRLHANEQNKKDTRCGFPKRRRRRHGAWRAAGGRATDRTFIHFPRPSMRIDPSISGDGHQGRTRRSHSWISLDVKNADGSVRNWAWKAVLPNLFRNGITEGTLPIGTEIQLFGYQAKKRRNERRGRVRRDF